jgi:hypothetical protein
MVVKENIMKKVDILVAKIWKVIAEEAHSGLSFAEIVGVLEHIKFDLLNEAKTRSDTTS